MLARQRDDARAQDLERVEAEREALGGVGRPAEEGERPLGPAEDVDDAIADLLREQAEDVERAQHAERDQRVAQLAVVVRQHAERELEVAAAEHVLADEVLAEALARQARAHRLGRAAHEEDLLLIVPGTSKRSRPVSPATARSQNRRMGVMTLIVARAVGRALGRARDEPADRSVRAGAHAGAGRPLRRRAPGCARREPAHRRALVLLVAGQPSSTAVRIWPSCAVGASMTAGDAGRRVRAPAGAASTRTSLAASSRPRRLSAPRLGAIGDARSAFRTSAGPRRRRRRARRGRGRACRSPRLRASCMRRSVASGLGS